MRKIGLFAIAALALTVAAGKAEAQLGMGSSGPAASMPLNETKKVDEATQERRDEVDRNYRAVRGTIPAQDVAIDPWANMRGNETKPAQAQGKSATATKKKPAQ